MKVIEEFSKILKKLYVEHENKSNSTPGGIPDP